MADHQTHFEASGSHLVLTNAILLYRGGSARPISGYGSTGQEAAAFASYHAVEHGRDGQPTIAAGGPMSRAQLRHWTQALGRTASPEILPGNVLVAHADMLAWWTPAQVRPAFFDLSAPPAGLRALSGRVIVPLPYPAHLFVATRSGLGVYALPVDERPSADTAVLHSPILNVFIDGRLCWGNVPKPTALTVASMPEFERAVFDSWSTHPNAGQERTVAGKGGLVRLWDDLAVRRATRFPVRRLKAFTPVARRQTRPGTGAIGTEPVTVGRLVAAWTGR